MKHLFNKLSAFLLMLMCMSATVQADIVHHEVCEPTLSSRGFTQECWENTETGKFYSNSTCTQELTAENLAKAVVYAKLPSNPVTGSSEFNSVESDNTQTWGINLNWAAETTFSNAYSGWSSTPRYAEFTVVGNNVNDARLVWMKNQEAPQQGLYSVKIYVNGEEIFTQTQGAGETFGGVTVQSLSGLKSGDVVKFEACQIAQASYNTACPTFKVSLEYTFNGSDIIHHTPCNPTLANRGFTRDCWEDSKTGKIYSEETCTQELTNSDLASAVVYEKVPREFRPIMQTIDNYLEGFYVNHEQDTHMGVTHNWPGIAKFRRSYNDDRFLEFYINNDISNARLVWSKDKGATEYGKYTIKISVDDGTSVNTVYSIEQGDNTLEGVFVIPLPELKKGDLIYFYVDVDEAPTVDNDAVTIMVSMDYTLANAHDLSANEDPDNPGVYYTTFYDSSYSYFTNYDSSATAYTATISGDNLQLTPVKNDRIEKNNAVIIRSNSSTITLVSDDLSFSSNENVLRGVDVETSQSDYGDYQYYMLSYGQKGLGFYKMNAEMPLSAHKAFLPMPAGAQARAFRMVFADDNDVDGIQQIENGELEIENSAIYNLNGMRLNKLQKGINIVNGKKVIVK